MDMKLEAVVLPVSDVDRAKQFYKALGWREDADFVAEDDFRIVTHGRVIHVLNAPSPAATASLAIGDRIAARVLAMRS